MMIWEMMILCDEKRREQGWVTLVKSCWSIALKHLFLAIRFFYMVI